MRMLNSLLFSLGMALQFIDHVEIHLKKKVMSNANTNTFQTLFMFFFFILASCLEQFWGEVAFTIVYTINRIPIIVTNNQSPYECLYGKLHDYNILCVISSICFVFLQLYEHSKLEPRSRLFCFLQHGIEHKVYECWDPISKCLCQHVTFWEHKMFSILFIFQLSENYSLYFTNLSMELFPKSSSNNTNESPSLNFFMQDKQMITPQQHSKYLVHLWILHPNPIPFRPLIGPLKYVNHSLIYMIVIVILPLFLGKRFSLIEKLVLILIGNKQ